MITSLNFIPAIIAVVAGIAAAAQVRGVVGGQAGVTAGLIDKPIYGLGFIPTPTDNPIDKYTFQAITPGFGLFIGVGAIFFAYDGFYVTAGIQSEMKEPKKTPYALLYGLLIITIVYLSIAISLSIGSLDGTPSGLRW
ncbi:amino acid permease [bacterium]|nr:amino acid permease [bacterium]